MRRIILLVLVVLMASSGADANWRSTVRDADKQYEKGNYEEALVKYLEALDQQGDTTVVAFGLGNVLQVGEKFEDAANSFKAALMNPDTTVAADALYNLGNALFSQEKYDEAAQAYKLALHKNPRQMDYLHNLELAEHLKQQQEEQQQQQQNQDQQNRDQQQDDQQQDQQNKNQQQDQEQQDQEQQEQQEQDQQQQQNQQQDEQEQEQEEQQQQAAQSDTTLSKEDAERLLNALQVDEQEVLENIHKQPVEGTGGKDW